MCISRHARAELAFQLAAKHGVRLPYATIDDLRRAYEFPICSLFWISTTRAPMFCGRGRFLSLDPRLSRQSPFAGVVHVEIFFDPQTHSARGVPFGTCSTGCAAHCSSRSIGGNDLSADTLRAASLERVRCHEHAHGSAASSNAIAAIGLDSSETVIRRRNSVRCSLEPEKRDCRRRTCR